MSRPELTIKEELQNMIVITKEKAEKLANSNEVKEAAIWFNRARILSIAAEELNREEERLQSWCSQQP